MYDTDNSDGAELWDKVAGRLSKKNLPMKNVELQSASINFAEKYGKPYLIKPRIGQGTFRLLVTDAYKRRCAMTGESTLPVLEAAHIVPYSEGGTHSVTNGLLLRADFHKLYDSGLVSITPDYKIKISPQIREAWFNGKAYYRLQDQRLSSIPDAIGAQPDRDALHWHLKNKFIS